MCMPTVNVPLGGDMGEQVIVSTLPTCDFCDNLARYDFKTRMGPWANGCPEHWRANRLYPTLGTGKGQKLILASGKER